MASLDATHKLAFGGIRIPYSKFSIELKTPSHQHRYPHTPGAALEKMGREPYVFSITGVYDDCLTPEVLPANWTIALATLRRMAEDEQTDNAEVPLIGTIRAKIENLKIDIDARRTSGPEAVSFMLIEDMTDQFLDAYIFQTAQNALQTSYDNMVANDLASRFSAPSLSLWSQINNAVSDVLAIKDQAQLYAGLYESKILYAIDLIKTADSTLAELEDPLNNQVFQDLIAAWSALADLVNNRLLMNNDMQKYTVVRDSTLSEVAISISDIAGHTIEAGDLLGINLIPDPFSVRAGTSVNYYA